MLILILPEALKTLFLIKGFDLSVFMVFSYGNDIFNMSTQRFVGPYQPYQNMLADAANRFTLLDPRTGKEATDLNRIAELNPNQHDPNILWSIHNDNRAAITTPLGADQRYFFWHTFTDYVLLRLNPPGKYL